MRPARAGAAALVTLVLAAALSLAGCGKSEKGGVAVRPRRYSIGMALGSAEPTPGSLEALACQGLEQVAEAYGGYFKDEPGRPRFGDKVELRSLESRLEGKDREQLVRVLAEEGCDLVFGVGAPFADVMRKAARDFPRACFAIVDAPPPEPDDASNLVRVRFAEHEGSFLAGAFAGLLLKDRPKAKAGFIGGMDAPLVHEYDAGFRAGAAYADPALRGRGMLLRQYCGKDESASSDPATAKAIATAMYKAGAEIVFHAAGASGAGLFEAAAEADKLAIGSECDEGLAYSSDEKDRDKAAMGARIVTSMQKRADRAVFVLASELVGTDRVPAGERLFDLAHDGVGCAVNVLNRDRFEQYADTLGELKAKIASGEIRVPTDDPSCEAFIAALR